MNQNIDELIHSGLLMRVLASTELRSSNSMIEAEWRVPKHQWLFPSTLDRVEKVRKLMAFHVEEHNQRLPHSAFRGPAFDEMCFGNGEDVPSELQSANEVARQKRLERNRAPSCAVCEPHNAA